MNVKQYIQEGYIIVADQNIARLIQVDFPETRGNIHVIGDTYAYAGVAVDKVLVISDKDLPKVVGAISVMLWRAQEVAFIKRTKETLPKLCPKCIEEENLELTRAQGSCSKTDAENIAQIAMDKFIENLNGIADRMRMNDKF